MSAPDNDTERGSQSENDLRQELNNLLLRGLAISSYKCSCVIISWIERIIHITNGCLRTRFRFTARTESSNQDCL